jgi:hypothetical protein
MKYIYYCCLALAFTAFSAVGVSAQSGTYGNEWIDYSKIYYKFKVAAPGVYRISRSILEGEGLPAGVLGSNFKLYRDGREVPIYVSAEAMTSTDYIEFVGHGANGMLDKELYADPAWQPNTRISYFTDTASYYLTYDNGNGHLRYNEVANTIPATPPAAETYNWFTVGKNYKSAQTEGPSYDGFTGSGPNYGNPFFSPAFENGEGLVRAQIYAGNTENITLNTPNAVTGAGLNAVFNSAVTTRSYDNSYNNGNTRSVNVYMNGAPLTSGSLGVSVTRPLNTTFPASQLAGNNNLSYSIASSKTAFNYDIYGVSYLEVKYPRDFDMAGLNSYQFKLSANASQQYLVFTNFNQAARLYDTTNKQWYAGDVNGSETRFLIQPSASERTLVLVATGTGVISLPLNKKFTFNNHAATQGDYIMISHNKLNEPASGHNYLDEYKNYRASAAGGLHHVQLADVTELYDEFAYGYETHPLAIRHYLQYAYNNWAEKPTYVNIIGRGLQYEQYNEYYSNPAKYNFPIVPIYGNPGSDVNYVNFGTPRTQKIEVGRVSVWNGTELGQYLNKVIAYEAALKVGNDEDAMWKKKVVHLAGAENASEAIARLSTLDAAIPILEDTLMGAKVYTFAKGGPDPISLAQRQQLDSLINGGLNMITYFGHASPTLLGFNLPNPETYHANPKFPVFLALGCDVAQMFGAFTDKTISERYTLAPTGGAIALMATDNYGYTGFLDNYLFSYYNSVSKTNFGGTVGRHSMDANNKAFTDYCSSLGITSSFYFAQIESQILTGDPAIHAFGPAKPDYQLSLNTLKATPATLDISVDSFKLQVVVNNIGRATKDLVSVTVAHQGPTGQRTTIQTYQLANLYYADTATIWVPISSIADRGLNKYYVTVDAPNNIDELDETNNEAVMELFIYSDNLVPVYPKEFAIVYTPTVTLKASTLNPFRSQANYIIEIDTTTDFNSPLKQATNITSNGGVVKWTPSITMTDSTVYYWRTAIDSTINGGVQWSVSSFIYLAGGSPGWNQSHYYQYKRDTYQDMTIRNDRNFEFSKTNNTLVFYNTVIVGGFENTRTLLNNDMIQYSANGFYNIQIMVIDPSSGLIQRNSAAQAAIEGSVAPTNLNRGTFVHEFNTSTRNGRISARNFIENIPNDYYVIVRNAAWNAPGVIVSNVYIDTWKSDTTVLGSGQSLYHSVYNLGFTKIDSLIGSPRAYLFFRKKGSNAVPLQQMVNETIGQTLQMDLDIEGTGSKGSVNGTIIGPSTAWQTMKWKMHANDGLLQNDSAYVTIYGVEDNNAETQLYAGKSQDTSLSWIDAAQYPRLRLVWNTKDAQTATTPQLDYWRILYAPVADIALNPNAHFVYSDTVRAGGSNARTTSEQEISVAIENLTDVPMDSVLVNYRMIDATGNVVQLANQRYRPLAANDTLHADFTFNPNAYLGTNYLVVEANPDNDHPEEYMGNNTGYLPFLVSSPLPLDLLSFTGTLKNEATVLTWLTTNEQNVSHFELERSYDANIFLPVYKTNASNTHGEHTYSYTDNDWIKPGKPTVYYRLKMVDKNGKFTRSQIVKFGNDKNDILIINAYPNPASSLLNVEIQTSVNDEYTMKVVDVTGKELMRNSYKLTAGTNVLKLPVNQLVSGVYMLVMSSQHGEPQQMKFVKQ